MGIDFLRRYAVGISIEDGVLRLYPPELVRDRSYRGWASVELEPVYFGESGALYFFEIEIGGRRIPALFDLGAGLNMMNWPAARQMGLVAVRLGDDTLIEGVLESTPAVAEFHAEAVTTAGIRWRNELFLIGDLEIFAALTHDDSWLGNNRLGVR